MLPVVEQFSERVRAEVDFENRWTTQYRVPVLETFHPTAMIIAGLVVPKENTPEDPHRNLYNLQVPSEADAALVGQYIAYYKHYWHGVNAIRVMEERVIDIDSGANTIVFAHAAHSWVYRRVSWQNQIFFPRAADEHHFDSLHDLLLHVVGDYSELRWLEFLEGSS